VKPAGGRADQGGQPILDIHVDVFECARKCERPRFDFSQDRV